MTLNLAKSVVLRAARASSVVMYPFTLGNIVLNDVQVTDLGVIITPGLDFMKHYTRISSKACKTLGAIVRFAKGFKNKETLKLLYIALVRPHLEYASVIWNPRHLKYNQLLERVQHRFLRFAARVLGNPMRD